MNTIVVLILSIFFYPPLTIQDGADVNNKIICGISGRTWKSTYVFNIEQLPERCDIFTVGQFNFDVDDGINTHVMESDKGIIRSLVEAKKTVYMFVGFDTIEYEDWASILDPKDADTSRTQFIEPLVNFLIKFKINGILILCYNIFDGSINDFAGKISIFVSSMKKKVDNLIVGLIVFGNYYASFSNTTLFDFSTTNDVLDLYVIDMLFLNDCGKETVKTGINPITSTNPCMTTMERVTCSILATCIDKSKIYAGTLLVPILPDGLVPGDPMPVTTYSIYCSSTDQANSSQWCTNPSKLTYDQGAYAKTSYVGIFVQHLDTDDYEGACKCGLYPEINLFIDGWTGCTFKPCPKLDHN